MLIKKWRWKNDHSHKFGSALGILDQKVLLIYADPQANASSGLGVETPCAKSLLNLFNEDGKAGGKSNPFMIT